MHARAHANAHVRFFIMRNNMMHSNMLHTNGLLIFASLLIVILMPVACPTRPAFSRLPRAALRAGFCGGNFLLVAKKEQCGNNGGSNGGSTSLGNIKVLETHDWWEAALE